MITVLLVDDQPTMRSGLRMRLELEPDMAVVGEAGDGAAALALARETRPDVIIMDLEMPIMDGFTATAAIRSAVPESAVVVHSLYDDAANQARARAAGAVAFIGKHRLEAPLLAAIRRAGEQHEAQPAH
ncbi:MAG: Two-component transcriptional response regulator, LuxR family [uncultured Thermomicrobiales bacterium]|uniref:Two-component transcriptional response regulator, LuxR family n=1 Tax=uncultured Thermomicrobiales bacterium TaxID=1645740 RepID=A0A6J4VJW9_9BACT|nr:MAG: Two-component transcriptional response regulator, LuxR family [uncultured Thermomicrobiales bacterium]